MRRQTQTPACHPEFVRIRIGSLRCGAAFGAHRRDDKGEWDGEFKQHLLKYGIKPILARVKHPQTNGKIEKWFDTYKKFRKFFGSFDEFVDWYNNRPHGSLNFEELETPEQAF